MTREPFIGGVPIHGLVNVQVAASEEAQGSLEPLIRALRKEKLKVIQGLADPEQADVLTLVGDTRFFLSTLADMEQAPPVLLVAYEGLSVLAEAQVRDAGAVAEALANDRYSTQQVLRMVCRTDDEELLALNEAALLPSLNGTFMASEIKVDGELLWHDRGDGIIVCTPTGSTAYALSAGGPAVLGAADVLAVVPVCSEEDRPPLIVPATSELILANPESASGVELVVDGHARHKISGQAITITGAPGRLSLVRLTERRHGHLLGRVRLKRELGAELASAPPSARFIYKLLEHEGPLTPSEMARDSGLTSRTVRSALNHLVDLGLVVKRASLRDARTDVYDVAERAGGISGQ